MKPSNKLTPEDFTDRFIWEFADNMETDLPDETYVRPVAELPVTSLSGRIVGTQLRLANGSQVFGLLGNIDVTDPLSTEHFLTITVFHQGQRFDLARYHDVDYKRRGSAALAAFLGLPTDAVFPIDFDIRAVAVGNSACLCRSIPAVPVSRLSMKELIGLALK
jgi:hypothetical protein